MKKPNTSTQSALDPTGAKVFGLYRALLTQVAEDAPTAKVLFSNLPGPVRWERSNTGVFIGTLVGGFPADKVGISLTTDSCFILGAVRYSEDNINVFCSDGTGEGRDGGMVDSFIEITVAP